jgi:hypothetical protein
VRGKLLELFLIHLAVSKTARCLRESPQLSGAPAASFLASPAGVNQRGGQPQPRIGHGSCARTARARRAPPPPLGRRPAGAPPGSGVGPWSGRGPPGRAGRDAEPPRCAHSLHARRMLAGVRRVPPRRAQLAFVAARAQCALNPAPRPRRDGAGRRLSGWIGGGVGSMIAANDAVGAIESAVDDDNFGSTYAATQEGYVDADMAGGRGGGRPAAEGADGICVGFHACFRAGAAVAAGERPPGVAATAARLPVVHPRAVAAGNAPSGPPRSLPRDARVAGVQHPAYVRLWWLARWGGWGDGSAWHGTLAGRARPQPGKPGLPPPRMRARALRPWSGRGGPR